MAYFNPQKSFEALKDRVADTVKAQFPIVGDKNELVAKRVWVDDNLDPDDIRGQKDAKLKGRTWAVPVRAEFELRDKATGKVKDRQTVTVAQLPKITRRYSYVVNGNEYQVNNLFRLKSGVYSRFGAGGALEGQWNLAKGLGFRMKFDPKSKKMSMQYPTGANVALYPVLKNLGVSDDDLERKWGREILSANMADKEDVALRKFYKSFNKKNPESIEEARKFMTEELGKTELRGDSTKLTLGKEFNTVDGSALFEGSQKLLRVARKEDEPDDRDSLAFKELWSAEDLVGERLEKKHKWDIQRKIKNTLDKHDKVKKIVNPDFIGKPIKAFFSNSALADRPDQMNPVSFTSGNRRTTLMAPGEGGISSAHQISVEAQSINPSHTAFLDPIQTPESDRIGINLQLASGVKKVGRELRVKAFNTKTKKMEWINPTRAASSTVAFPDQYEWTGNVPKPVGKQVKVSDEEGIITTKSPKKVDYILKSTKGMFDLSANMIPFLQSDQGNRTMVAAKQMEQAVSLVAREQPLVQSKGDKSITFEQSMGAFNSHHAPVDGVVKQVRKDSIIIEGADGKRNEVQTYDDFPLNDNRSLLNSTAKVKAGDKVTKGQLIADTNFTKDGTLALGTNLKIAYIPFKGYNFEDGIVISEGASKKLTSEHMHREAISQEANIILHKDKFLAASAGNVTKDQANKLDDQGVIREGEVVYPGDILIGALRKEEIRPESQQLGLFSKKLIKPVRPRAQTWTKDTPGIVNRVVKHGKKTTVFVKTLSPAVIGDKIVGRHGNKGIITIIMPDHEMPHDKDGAAMDVLLNPAGIPSRINLGQVLETAASKIAKKTGKTYVVDNFDPKNKDYTRNLMAEMKQHGVSDTEDLIDPSTSRTMKDVMTGDQYIMKLHHMAEKGLQARSRDSYDSNMTPKEGGPKGGQTMDALGLYALLAHNARHNIREFQTYKCFLRRTTVETDHGPMMISKIVNQRLPVKVLSWDGINLEYRKILNYWRREIDTPLVKVKFMARDRSGRFKYAITKCTQGHKFYTPSGEVEAKDLEGKQLLTPGLIPGPHQLNLLIGSLLGDGSLQKGEHYFPAFQERHSIKQREYLEFKAAILADFSNRSVRDYCAGYEGFNVGQTMCEWGTLAQPSFYGTGGNGLYGAFYKDKVKKVPDHIESLLEPMTVAVWYQDDGSLTRTSTQRVLKLHTGNFNEKDRQLLIDGLEARIGVRFTESKNNSSMDLRLGKRADIDRFLNYIRAYVHPSMAYKVDGPVGEALDRVMDEAGAHETLVEVPVISVTGYDNPTYNDGKYLYNLEVEGNHNYFANRTLVGNSDYNDSFWTSIQAGDPIPPPKVPFVHKKFEGYLKGMGVDVRKDGNSMILTPLTDKKVREMSEGREIKDPSLMLRGKDARPEPKGLFDPVATGTPAGGGQLGDKWSHFPLAEKMPSPFFEKPIRSLLGLTEKQFESVMAGEEKLGGKIGPAAVVSSIKKIDVKGRLKELEPNLRKLRGTELNKTNKQVKYLRALQKLKMTPSEAYTQKLVPVLPPSMRPYAVLDDGSIKYDDVNELYKQLGATNDQLKRYDPAMGSETKIGLQKELYDGLKGLALIGTTSRGRHFNGIGETIAGRQAKEGYFQKRVIGRRQDLSMRGVIIPEPSLSLDEIAIPRKAASELYKPFVVRRLVRLGYTPLQAQRQVNENTSIAKSALETEVDHRPLLVKRDPVLHKYGVQAFKPRLVDGKAIKIHPLVTGGFNADFDGDKMSAYAPVSEEAVREAYGMMPSKNLFSSAHGKIMFKPGQEAMLGLYKLTEIGKETSKKFDSVKDLGKALGLGSINMDDIVTLGSVDGDLNDLIKVAAAVRTTAGRVAVYNALPKEMRNKKILTDKNYVLDKKQVAEVLTDVGKKHNSDFTRTADALKNMGNAYSTGLSFSLKDFVSDRESRDPILKKAEMDEAKIRSSTISTAKKNRAVVDLYIKAAASIDKKAKAKADKSGNRMYDWVKSGARGNWDQFKQITVAPILVTDSSGEPVPIPITKSYSEGLDIGSYWASMHGARMGTIGRVQGTMQPGMLSKQMSNVSMNQVVVDDDCGTEGGVTMSLDDRGVLGRYTSNAIKLGVRGGKEKGTIPKGSLIDTGVLSRMKNNKVSSVKARSPLKCEHGEGICAKCYGINENGDNFQPGTNVGIMASHALGEPATQLAMNAFHSGGVVGARGSSMDSFNRLQQLLAMPKTLPESAVLATVSGDVESVDKDPAGGWNVMVKGERHYVPSRRNLLVKKGQSVRPGESLSDGPKNPHELLKYTNIGNVQRYITDEIYDIYKGEGPVKKRNIETFVRSLTNLGRVTDPGDHPNYLTGDHVPTTEILAFNRKLGKGQLKVEIDPVLKSVAMLPLELQTDWVARMNGGYLKRTLIDAAAEGWQSRVHGAHPIPGMAYGAEFGLSPKDKPYMY